VRIQPLVAALIERARAGGRLRADVGDGDIEIVFVMVGALMDASIHVDPDLWRRYLAIILDGIQRGSRHDALPGTTPAQPEVERILAGWIPPPRGQSQPRDPAPAAPVGTQSSPSEPTEPSPF